MATQIVEYTSTSKLSCVGCARVPIILCVNPDKLKPQVCENLTPSTFEFQTIPALLLKTEEFCKYGKKHFQYIIGYEEDLLIEDEVLECTDINGIICDTCLLDYARDKFGDEIRIEDIGDQPTLITQHGCQYPLNSGGGGAGNTLAGFMFGDGSDGDLTVLNGQDILLPYPARAYLFENVTVDAGGILNTYGQIFPGSPFIQDYQYFQIYINGTLTINGTVSANGIDGNNAVGATSGALRSPISTPNSPGGGGGSGGRGGNGKTGAAGNGSAGVSGSTDSLEAGAAFLAGGSAGAGGNGGLAGVNAGGAGGPNQDQFLARYTTQKMIPFGLWDWSSPDSYILNVVGGGNGGAGGGGGARSGGSGTSIGGGGGSGGVGAGCVYIFARNIVIGPTGSITAIGGNGGNGANATTTGGIAGGGGAGSGGGGGLIYLVYETFVSTGTFDVSPGASGTFGLGAGGGADGAIGLPSNPGHVTLLNIQTGNFE